ncbi:MAG TPA: PLP-dependent aminotransferase family protein [Actinobacteria bacterium]|nr:PLP-dependent aminotransferase family protein [Actinomycetota bacterium]
MPEFIFDKWTELYSDKTQALRSSQIRDLLSVTARPDIISFAGGLPYTKPIKAEAIVAATEKTLSNDKDSALQYCASEGHLGLRKHIIEFLKAENISVHDDDILITVGAQQALDLIGKIFIDKNDIILTESPSYVGALNAFLGYGAKIETVPLDNNGLQVNKLKEKLKTLNKKPKFFYTVPNFHNPAGVTMSKKRRHDLIKLAEKEDLLIIEDNAYSMLGFNPDDKFPALRSLSEDVIYLGTFSKIFFAPGARLGWVVAPKAVLEKLLLAKQAADLCTGTLSQVITEEYLNLKPWRPRVKQMTRIYEKKKDVMLGALEKYFPKDTSWTKPKGGFYIWVKLPYFVDTTQMLAEAINEKVAFVPGNNFYPDDDGKNFIRLSYCLPEAKEIEQGIKRLGQVVKSRIELYRSFKKYR